MTFQFSSYPHSPGSGAAFLQSRRRLLARAFGRDAALRRLDWLLVLAVAVLCATGALLVWSATRTQLLTADADPQYFLKRQTLNILLGAVLAVLVACVDYRLLRPYAPLLYGVCCLALVLVLTPLGVTINGSSSWLGFPGGFQVQPSEITKVALLLMLAILLGELRDGGANPNDRDVVRTLVLAAVPMGLILMQPDLGTSLVFGAMVMGVLAVSGAPRRWLFGLVAGALAMAAGMVYFRILKPYQLERFTAFVNPTAAPESATYSAEQARLAIGSGGVTGKGLFQGLLTNGQFVPEQTSDFIFTVAGEEFGFVGSAILVTLIGLVLWRGLRIATQAEDDFGMLLASGVVCWFGFQAFQNIGMSVGLMPITGLPLPFISYGGSAMFANLIAVGLLVNVHLASTRRSELGRLGRPGR